MEQCHLRHPQHCRYGHRDGEQLLGFSLASQGIPQLEACGWSTRAQWRSPPTQPASKQSSPSNRADGSLATVTSTVLRGSSSIKTSKSYAFSTVAGPSFSAVL